MASYNVSFHCYPGVKTFEDYELEVRPSRSVTPSIVIQGSEPYMAFTKESAIRFANDILAAAKTVKDAPVPLDPTYRVTYVSSLGHEKVVTGKNFEILDGYFKLIVDGSTIRRSMDRFRKVSLV